MSTQPKNNAIMTFMEEKFVPMAAKIGGQRHLLALRDGIVMVMPLLIIGAFSMIIGEFPIDAFLAFMANVFGENWNAFMGVIMDATYSIAAIVACFGVASSLANSYDIDGTPAGIISISALFAIVVPQSLDVVGEGIVSMLAPSTFDPGMLFTALFTALIVGELYRFMVQRNFTIKLPASVPQAVSRQFTALIPGTIIIILFTIIRLIFSITPWGSFPDFISAVISAPLRGLGTSYIGTLLVVFFEHLLWSFGLHGSAIIVFPFFEPMWLENMAENLRGASNIVTFTFYENGVWIGGSGATLPAVVYMLLFAKSKLLRDVGKIGIGPSIFNINEPVTFGLPIVLNPVLIVPYILAPMAAMSVQYFGTAIGLFPLCNNMVPWTTPILISGFLTTGSFMGVIAQLVALAAAFIIWIPFIMAWDRTNYRMELEAAKV